MAEANEPSIAALSRLITESEDWLMARILHYAKAQGFTAYTSTLLEPWRLSISGLSASLTTALTRSPAEREMTPDEDYNTDPAAAFGLDEARRHRQRGVSLSMFLGLMKYYRQAYLDLVDTGTVADDLRPACRHAVMRFFDRVEIGLTTAWLSTIETDRIGEMQEANRRMTNEKNKYLTVFESLPMAVILVGDDLRVEEMNDSARRFAGKTIRPTPPHDPPAPAGRSAGDKRSFSALFPWLAAPVAQFMRDNQPGMYFITEMQSGDRRRNIHVRLSRMLDVSEKFRGTLVFLEDVSERFQAEQARSESERLKGVLETAGAVGHELNQPLQSVMGQCELMFLDLDPSSPILPRMATIRNQVYKMADITRKLMGITRYRTKRHGEDEILDIDEASES